VGPRAVLDVREKSRPTGIRSPDRPARSQSLYRQSYSGPKPYYTDVELNGTAVSFHKDQYQTQTDALLYIAVRWAAFSQLLPCNGRFLISEYWRFYLKLIRTAVTKFKTIICNEKLNIFWEWRYTSTYSNICNSWSCVMNFMSLAGQLYTWVYPK
jgi:hypothetical protein